MRFAIKRLTASDLTFFEYHFRRLASVKQKAINLNADVFVGQLFPFLQSAAALEPKLGVDLFIFGPGEHGALNLQRKIVKGAGYKNWRLNGELIYNPDDAPERFSALAPRDLAVMGFEGESKPEVLYIALLAASIEPGVHQRVESLLGSRSMIALDETAYRRSLRDLGVPEDHVLWTFSVDMVLQDLAEGVAVDVARAERRQSARRVSREQLAQARLGADAIGRLGEEIFCAYLQRCMDSGEIEDFRWVADENAIAPYDFEFCRGGTWFMVEVKATSGAFERPFHMSAAELEFAANSASYMIARVAEVDSAAGTGLLYMASEGSALAAAILGASSGLPVGVKIDGVTIPPTLLQFVSYGRVEIPPSRPSLELA